MLLLKMVLNLTLIVCTIFGCAAAVVGQEAKEKLAIASGLAKVKVTHVEKVKNTGRPVAKKGENLDVSLKILSSTGYTQKRLLIKLPSEEADPTIKTPLVDPNKVAVGNIYWIAFTKSFGPYDPNTENPHGVAAIWSEIDSKTEELFRKMIREDKLNFQYEHVPQLTDIGFGFRDPVGKAEQFLPSINYVHLEIDKLEKQQRDDDSRLRAVVHSIEFETNNTRPTPPVPPAKKKRIDLLRAQFHKRTEFRDEQIKQLQTLMRKFEDELDALLEETDPYDSRLEKTVNYAFSGIEDPSSEKSWRVQATRKGEILWTRKIPGKTLAPARLRNFEESLTEQRYWVRFIANPRGTQDWLPKGVLGMGYKLAQPAPKSLCALFSWEGENFTQYYLNAETGARCILVTFETRQGPAILGRTTYGSRAESVLKSIREYSAADKLIRKREFIAPETKVEGKLIQLDTTFDPEGKILTADTSTVDASVILSVLKGPFGF